MSKKEALKIFDNNNVRVVWDDEQQEWYFCVVDVIEVLTDSINPTDYLKKMRKRDPELNVYMGTNCPQVLMTTPTGKRRKTLAANSEQLFRIIQSIPSSKAEPFKQWMALVAAERLDQMQDPELSIDQAVADYQRLGYSESWINQRLKSIDQLESQLGHSVVTSLNAKDYFKSIEQKENEQLDSNSDDK